MNNSKITYISNRKDTFIYKINLIKKNFVILYYVKMNIYQMKLSAKNMKYQMKQNQNYNFNYPFN